MVTVLNNPSFPLLRYAIGDVTDRPVAFPERGFAVLGRVSGRNNDYVVTPFGARIHSSRFDAFFKYETEDIRRFRVHQQNDGSLHVAVELRSANSPLDLPALVAKLKMLVDGCPVTVDVVDELPQTQAGKHRLVVSDLARPDLPGCRMPSALEPSPPASAGLADRPGTPAGDADVRSLAGHDSRAPLPRKAEVLRRLLFAPTLTFLMEAHNGLSARIAEEAGFEALWASGLSISAALGVRDSNEASWTQVLDVLEFMSDATRIPILVDGDTGHGNFNNARRLVRKLEQRNLGGVCIEDKLFPKTNSFLARDVQPLADVEEFCGRMQGRQGCPALR